MNTGTGLSIITKDDIQSYNSKVYTINKLQRRNANIMDNAVDSLKDNNALFLSSLLQLTASLTSLKKQVFGNDVLITNWNKNPPYSYNMNILD